MAVPGCVDERIERRIGTVACNWVPKQTTKNSLHYTKPCISTNTHKNMSPDDGTVATPHERPPLLRGHFHTTFRVAAGEGFYCTL